jgi:CheY-like chemotaxis protein
VNRETAKGSALSVPAAKRRILVVDDDPMMRMLIAAILRRGGFEVDEAEDGAVALQRLAGGEDYCMVVTDLQMPGLDGDELIRRLRADPARGSLPVILLTASDGGTREADVLELGATQYLQKPVNPARLIESVGAALAGDR